MNVEYRYHTDVIFETADSDPIPREGDWVQIGSKGYFVKGVLWVMERSKYVVVVLGELK